MTATPEPTQVLVVEVGELLGYALSAATANRRRDVLDRLVTVRDVLEALVDPLGPGFSAWVDPERRTVALREVLERIARSFATMESDLRARRAMLEDPSRSARLRAELRNARTGAELSAAAVKEWQHVLGDGFAALNSDTEFDLRMRIRAVVAEREAALNIGDPGLLVHADVALRERLIVETEHAYRQLFDGACAIAGQVAAMLESPAPYQFPGLAVVAPAQLVSALAPPRQPRSDLPLPARLLRVFRPGWSGIMMAVIATRLLGVQVPNVVLAGLALFGAVALGGAALTGERKRRLDRRRGDAVAALRATVEEFRLSLSKQLRDASRAVQRDLRREASVTAVRRAGVHAAELEAVRRATEVDRRSADELAQIARELTALGEHRRRARTLGTQLQIAAPDAGADSDPSGVPGSTATGWPRTGSANLTVSRRLRVVT
jgi:hypothetical protein